MPEQFLESENERTLVKELVENLELKPGPWVRRRSVIAAGELFALISIILIFGITGAISPEITGGLSLGAFVAETFSICATKKPLIYNLLSLSESSTTNFPRIFSRPQKKFATINKPKDPNNTFHTSFRTVLGIIKKKNLQATENSKLINQSESNFDYESNGKTEISQIKKTEQFPEQKGDELLGSLKYEQKIPMNTEENAASLKS